MKKSTDNQDLEINAAALEYHQNPPGKLAIAVTKPTATQDDLSLAYTPGVAEPVRKIAKSPDDAYKYTTKGNLVAVITDGTAVLGLGNVGSLASKPVMEGKAMLFKHFADIDVFDIEVNADTPEDFIDTVKRISPTFGGINLEDIAAPHCFDIEQQLVELLDIPVFHDDQHGTAIITAAGLLNALEIQGKELEDVKIVVIGAGAAGIATINLLKRMGAQDNHFLVIDRKGIIHTGRDDLHPSKQSVAADTSLRTLKEAMAGADVVIGVSGPNLISEDMLLTMAEKPVVFALSNPVPEILPAVALSTRDDLVMATGRSDYPNQVNNVLGFPFIFRGALDARATRINPEMHIAAVNGLRALAKEPVPESVLKAYNLESLSFGADYIIPKPLDPRLGQFVAEAVKQAALETGVARS